MMRGVYATQICTRMHAFSEIPFLSTMFPWHKDPMTCKCQVLLDSRDHFDERCTLAEFFPIMYGTSASEI